MKYFSQKHIDKPIMPTRFGALLVCLLFFLTISTFGLVSAFDTDNTVSQKENRTLKQAPKFSIITLFNGTYNSDFSDYFADTFPARDFFLAVNSKISSVFSKNGSGDNNMVIVEKQDKDDFAGQDITYNE